MFFMKILSILPKFHEKTLSRPGDIKIFRPGRRMYMYTLPPFMDVVLSEERQSMKLVGIFPVGIFWMVIFWGEGIFQRQFDGWGFSLGEIFLEPCVIYCFKILSLSRTFLKSSVFVKLLDKDTQVKYKILFTDSFVKFTKQFSLLWLAERIVNFQNSFVSRIFRKYTMSIRH